MRAWPAMLLVAVMVLALAGGCAQTEQAEEAVPEHVEEAVEGEMAEEAAGMAVDPVCGMEVAMEGAITHEYEGNMYYFCSEDCRDKFMADPATYMMPEEDMPEEEMPEEEMPAEGEMGTS